MIQPIELGARLLGPDEPALVVAEVGINHDGDLSVAHRLIDEAADAGAGGVKFQNYKTEDFVLDRDLTWSYPGPSGMVTQSQYDMFKERELPQSALAELRSHAGERSLVFMSTPTSSDGVAELVAVGADAVKNGSDFLGHLPLIEDMARSGLPTVLSVGMATLGDIDDAVRAFRSAGGRELVLLHCTSNYPTAPSDVHLRKIPALLAAFGCPIGFSDHTEGVIAAAVAVSLGATFVEKHVTLGKDRIGPDHRFSSDPEELAELVEAVRTAEAALGTSVVGPADTEAAARLEYRLSCVAAADLGAGHVLTDGDLAFLRPGTGVAPRDRGWLVGRAVTRSVRLGEQITIDDVR